MPQEVLRTGAISDVLLLQPSAPQPRGDDGYGKGHRGSREQDEGRGRQTSRCQAARRRHRAKAGGTHGDVDVIESGEGVSHHATIVAVAG